MQSTMTVLTVRDLRISFGKTLALPAVRDISFEIGENETLAVVGESGSGKSITALSIMRLLSKRVARVSGEILFNGQDLLKLTDREMRAVRGNDIAMIFQEPMTSLNPVLTAGHQIVETLRCHRDLDYAAAKAEAIALLDQVRIPEARSRFDYYPHQMSGGMRQRVMIALALSCNPSLLIADEPTTALDVTIQAQILNLVRRLQREIGMSILFVTHNLGVVAEIAHEVAVMYAGRVVEQAPVEALFERPKHPYTLGLIACIPDVRRDIAADGSRQPLHPIPGIVPPITHLPPGCPFAPRCPYIEDACTARVPDLVVADSAHLSRCRRHEIL